MVSCVVGFLVLHLHSETQCSPMELLSNLFNISADFFVITHSDNAF